MQLLTLAQDQRLSIPGYTIKLDLLKRSKQQSMPRRVIISQQMPGDTGSADPPSVLLSRA